MLDTRHSMLGNREHKPALFVSFVPLIPAVPQNGKHRAKASVLETV
jgi:hypothetical protein